MNTYIDNRDILDNDIISIVEDGMNTSYIDCLLITLFYKPNKYLISQLDKNPDKPSGIYLQELIKEKFIEPLQRNFSISSSTLNEIRNYSAICGFNMIDIIKEQNIIDYYSFLSDLFNLEKLVIDVEEIKDNVIKVNNTVNLKNITFIPTVDTNIKNLLVNWINNNILKTNIQLNTMNTYNIYSLQNIPNFIIINIDRFNNQNKNKFKIDIMRKIKFFNNNIQSQNYLKWRLQSIICHSGETIESGHYYTIIYNKNKSLIFDNKSFPSFNKININDDEVRDKIMSECVLLLYTIID
jgi:hypothetical protein